MIRGYLSVESVCFCFHQHIDHNLFSVGLQMTHSGSVWPCARNCCFPSKQQNRFPQAVSPNFLIDSAPIAWLSHGNARKGNFNQGEKHDQ